MFCYTYINLMYMTNTIFYGMFSAFVSCFLQNYCLRLSSQIAFLNMLQIIMPLRDVMSLEM